MVWIGLVGLGPAVRLLDHPPNCTPMAAIALFAAFWIESRVLAVTVPLMAIGLSDLQLPGYGWEIRAAVYLALLFPVVFRGWLRSRLSAWRLGACAFMSSLVFFLVSNLAEWWFGYLYERTAAGLVECFVAALPFFRNTLIGDFGWSAALFGTYALVVHLEELRRLRPIPVEKREK